MGACERYEQATVQLTQVERLPSSPFVLSDSAFSRSQAPIFAFCSKT